MKRSPMTGHPVDLPSGENGEVSYAYSLRYLDAIAQITIQDRDLTTPPDEPDEGDTYIPAATATGDWTGQEDRLAVWDEEHVTWWFVTPEAGWIAWIADKDIAFIYNGANWILLSISRYGSILLADGSTPQSSIGTSFATLTGWSMNGNAQDTQPNNSASQITIDKAGVYSILFQISLEGTVSTKFTFRLNDGSGRNEQCLIEINSSGNAECGFIACTDYFAAATVISVDVKANGAGKTITSTDMQLTVKS